MVRYLLLSIALLILSGCGAPRAVLWHGQNSNPASIAAAQAAVIKPTEPEYVVPILVATSRKRSDNFSMPYGSERSKQLNFSRVNVGIPAAHVKGQVEVNGYKPDPAKHFAAVSFQPFDDSSQFINEVNAALAKRGPNNQELMIFVHGYNNNFADSTFRTAQFTHDYALNALPIHYSWPSGGSLGLYAYDRDSADFARDGLAKLLIMASKTNAKKILLIGHSMGSYVVMEALRTLSLNEEVGALKAITNVMLAAPDIDLDVFEMQVKDIHPLPMPFVILVSRKDSALNISGRITGGHARVGDGSSIATLQEYGIVVLDATKLDGGAHTVFASSPSLMSLVQSGDLSFSALKNESQTPGEAMLADGTSIVTGAASMVVYLPIRILSAATAGFK